jgi:hypothetical protein
MGLVLELFCLFALGFMTSSVIGIAVAWARGMHYAEPFDHDEDSQAIVPHTGRRVSWLPTAVPIAPAEYGGSPSSSD